MHHLEGVTGRYPMICCGDGWIWGKRGAGIAHGDGAEMSGEGGPGAGEDQPRELTADRARRIRGEGRALLAEHRVDPELKPYAWLLGLLAVVFLVEGIVARPSDPVIVVLTALLATTTVLALYIGHVRRGVLVGGAVVGAALVLTTLIEALTGGVDEATVAIANAFLVALAPAAILIGVIRRLTTVRAVTIEAVIGVLSVYLLLGMLFAFVYAAVDRLGTAPFFAQNVAATVSQCQYFSFTTLATVGYGDLTARSNLGHTLSVFEAVLGQVYLVTVVSLIVGNLGRRRRDAATSQPQAD
jgi:hypothetical protein